VGEAAAGLDFRRAGGADVGALVDLRIEFMRVVKDGNFPDEAEWRRELASRFSADLASGALVAWICLDRGRVVAASGLACPGSGAARAELALRPGEALVFNMFTRPAYRRRGIASELLARLIAEARARGIRALRLRPTDDGRPLYERLGFRDDGEDMLLRL
jgi:GNAT superfamily N-acetyltransferase